MSNPIDTDKSHCNDRSAATPIRVSVPGSKSETARALVLNHLTQGEKALIKGGSEADDIVSMKRALSQAEIGKRVDVGESGTAYRFLTALCSIKEGFDGIVTGEPSLIRRPLSPLVKALKEIGAEIDYGDEGPLITGHKLKGGIVTIDPSISSQFISALMLIGPLCEEGMEIRFKEGKRCVSTPYLQLTASYMRKYGVEVEMRESGITIPAKAYVAPDVIKIPGDWTSASYLLCAARLCRKEIVIENLTYEGIQNDREITEWLDEPTDTVATHDFSNCPDLFPTMAVYYCLIGRRYNFRGVKNLRIKESDRLAAVCDGLRKCGFDVSYDADTFAWNGKTSNSADIPEIDSYHDHRIVMAFSLVGLQRPIKISGSECVSKSFPAFLQTLQRFRPQIQKKDGPV